jgi:hypothetical protein
MHNKNILIKIIFLIGPLYNLKKVLHKMLNKYIEKEIIKPYENLTSGATNQIIFEIRNKNKII